MMSRGSSLSARDRRHPGERRDHADDLVARASRSESTTNASSTVTTGYSGPDHRHEAQLPLVAAAVNRPSPARSSTPIATIAGMNSRRGNAGDPSKPQNAGSAKRAEDGRSLHQEHPDNPAELAAASAVAVSAAAERREQRQADACGDDPRPPRLASRVVGAQQRRR